jgi:acyl-CoA thioester hydrolase
MPLSEPPQGYHITSLRVRYAETDAMGVAHHASFLPWLESARVEWLRHHGVSYAELERAGLRLPVVELRIRYRAPARFDDLVHICTGLVERTRARVRFIYTIYRDGETTPLAEAETVHCYLDPAGRPIRLARDGVYWQLLQRLPVAGSLEAEP